MDQRSKRTQGNNMEAGERQVSSKAPKNGGKHAKQLSAEAEARREVIRETLRERLELEKRAHQVVERLIEDRVSDDFLLDCAKLITTANYKDVVEERFITKLCGYPLCSNKLEKIPKQQYKISTKTNKVYDITERKSFCSNFCYKASKEFELQISKTPLWLRHDERPPEIKLKKKGNIGSSGEEVCLTPKCLQEDDIEQPLNTQPEDHQDRSFTAGHSDSSDDEREQDFISSVVSREQRPRVHWGDRPKRKNEGEGVRRPQAERRKGESRQNQKLEKEVKMTRDESFANGTVHEEVPEEAKVDEVMDKLKSCSLHAATQPQEDLTAPATTPPLIESTHQRESSSQNRQDLVVLNADSVPSLNIIQVGMSKRGATGLRSLLKNHGPATKHNLIGQSLLESLRVTLNDWLTEESIKFLHGADCTLDPPSIYMKEEEEELDEDDLEDDVTEGSGGEEERRALLPAPDYETLKRETQQMVLKVREFYKGTWIVAEDEEKMNGNEETTQDQSTSDSPSLPLVDSKAQHLIQKRITVEKLASCLRNIVGPLSLTLSDITSDLNNLVRTFRFTNTNIIHKPPEWTLIAVVLLHLLSNVSPVVAEALKTPSSVLYINTLMEELGLQQQDLLNLLQPFKTIPH
ncbi:putative RNA polymerase II subunit B1 CTD phosphatase rpap2 isoform X2 [Syngnathoides biaculeatus]|uniref:putative RNA polymerase II subunit B1 CTD phosphatase rpap2 isoform X2 n=1 Tax=Syngnathoides biaculeatus TaxID=300417 RepID=UPI002ADD994A|nr:putative RNA polymerase II subunit B1 CTD phosphatase rpap2 isoform X2 [Syngnathoides biaculeatus]